MLPEFMEHYPKIKVDLKLTNCVSKLDSHQIDIYICHDLALQNRENFHVEPLIEIHNHIYASPTYIEKHGRPKTLKDLTHHNCLTLHCDGTSWDFGDVQIPISGNLQTNNTTAAINAALAGIGIISMCSNLINEEIKQKKLIPLFPEHKIRSRIINAFYPKQKFVPQKTLAFIDYIKQETKKWQCEISFR